MKTQFLEPGQVAYLETGTPGRTKIIFVHGFPERKEAWSWQLESLARRYHCFAIDLPGFGETKLPGGLSSSAYFDFMTSTLSNCIQTLGDLSTSKLIVVGHDWGGILAQMVLDKIKVSVDQLVLLNSPHPIKFLNLIETNNEQANRSKYISYLLSSHFAPTERASDFKRLRFSLFDSDSGLPDSLKKLYTSSWSEMGQLENMASIYALVAELKTRSVSPISIPTQILWGAKDHALAIENIQNLENYYSNLKVETFPDLNHWTNHTLQEKLGEYLLV